MTYFDQRNDDGGKISDQDFDEISRFMHTETGIVLNDTKRAMVVSRLLRRCRELGISSLSDYCSFLKSQTSGEERLQMISTLTTNVTHFFRENHHFEDLKTNVFPELVARAERGGRVRLWSAGCSTGQEVYSLGLTLLGLSELISDYDVRILGTDLDPCVLNEARLGLYTNTQLLPLNEDLKQYFRPSNTSDVMHEPCAELRRLVAFRELNLLHAWPMNGLFDVIMCRNVTIYFDQETQQNLWKRFATMIPEGGRLYVGHSEYRVEDAGCSFEPVAAGVLRRSGRPVEFSQ
jgi:chemotaxis protein methyltransferase CheR